MPKQLAPTDQAARWAAATRERAFFAYSTNYMIDLDHAVIVAVEATTAVRQAEVIAQRRMIERTRDRLGLWPETEEGAERRRAGGGLIFALGGVHQERRSMSKTALVTGVLGGVGSSVAAGKYVEYFAPCYVGQSMIGPRRRCRGPQA